MALFRGPRLRRRLLAGEARYQSVSRTRGAPGRHGTALARLSRFALAVSRE